MAKKGERGPNKMQLVRDALAALGSDAKPLAIQEWIKKESGVEMAPQMISSYKSNLGKKGKKKKGAGRPAKAAAKGGDILGDIATVKSLLGTHGRANLIKLIDALS